MAEALRYFIGIWEVTVNSLGDREGHWSSQDLKLKEEIHISFQEKFQIWRSFSFFSRTTDRRHVSASSFLLGRHTLICPFKEKVTMSESCGFSKEPGLGMEHL